MVSFLAISSQFNAVERQKKTFWKKKLKAYIVPYYITTTLSEKCNNHNKFTISQSETVYCPDILRYRVADLLWSEGNFLPINSLLVRFDGIPCCFGSARYG